MSDNVQAGLERLRDLVKGIHAAMLTTAEEDGSLRSRPMGTPEIQSDGVVWLITAADAEKVHDISREQHVNLAYAKPDKTWVSVSGTATLVRDPEMARKLWNPFVDAWFPGGPDDPNVALLKVQIQQADYWEASGPDPVVLFKVLKARAVNERPNVGEHGTLDLKMGN